MARRQALPGCFTSSRPCSQISTARPSDSRKAAAQLPHQRTPPPRTYRCRCHSAHPASPICTTDLCQALVLDNCFARAGTLAATIGASYQEQMVTQLYKLFFSIELLGNPRGLFTKMATGVTDAFYEPMAGLVRGPEEFAHGVLRGGKSLVDNVVVGVTDSIGKITGSLAKGVAELSMDKECAARVPWRNRPHLLLP